MILSETSVLERLNSPDNLINRLSSLTQVSPRSRISKINIPTIPTSEEIIPNLEEKLALGSIKSKAASIMSDVLDTLKTRVPTIEKTAELASVAEKMSKVISNTQISKDDNRDNAPQIIVYAPTILDERHFSVIDIEDKERE